MSRAGTRGVGATAAWRGAGRAGWSVPLRPGARVRPIPGRRLAGRRLAAGPWLAALVVSLLLAGCGTDVERPPNLLLVSIDTLRADRLGCYGADRAPAPNIDALAARGTVFTNVMSPSSWTLPSHASLLTGRLPAGHGLADDGVRLSGEVATLAERLRSSGYRTLAVVSHVYVSSAFGLDRGFDAFDDTLIAGGTTNPVAAPVVDRALELLASAPDDGRPWFLFVHLFDPHWPYTPPPPYDGRFTDPGYAGVHDGRYEPILEHERSGLPLAPADEQQLLALYDGEIAYVDAELGRLLADLERRSELASTVVVVTADHGEEFEEHGALGHGKTLFVEQLGVPLVIAGQPFANGARRDDPVSTIDVAPTLLALAGAEPLEELDGHALIDRVPDDRLRVAESIRFGLELRAARRGRHKLIHVSGSEASVLYDVVEDPGEQRALDVDPTGGALRAALDDYAARAHAGWHLKILGGPHGVTRCQAEIRTPGRIVDVRRYFSANILGASAQFRVFEVSPDGHALTFDLGLRAHMGEVVFETEPDDAPVTFELTVTSDDPRAGVFLGTDQRLPDGVEIELARDDERVAAGVVDHRVAAPGVYVRAVGHRAGTEPVELSDETVEHLRQLGYLGEGEDG